MAPTAAVAESDTRTLHGGTPMAASMRRGKPPSGKSTTMVEEPCSERAELPASKVCAHPHTSAQPLSLRVSRGSRGAAMLERQ
jgi:hypothetical protein